MGGGGRPPLLIDPAIEKHARMHDNTQQYYRFTPRAVRGAILLGIVFPVSLWYVASTFQGRMQVMGATHDEKRTWWIPREKLVETEMMEKIRQEREDQSKMPMYRPSA